MGVSERKVRETERKRASKLEGLMLAVVGLSIWGNLHVVTIGGKKLAGMNIFSLMPWTNRLLTHVSLFSIFVFKLQKLLKKTKKKEKPPKA